MHGNEIVMAFFGLLLLAGFVWFLKRQVSKGTPPGGGSGGRGGSGQEER